MSGFWPVLGIILFICLVTKRRRRERNYGPGPVQPDRRDEVIERLTERVRALEKIITDNDWQLRRDIDRL